MQNVFRRLSSYTILTLLFFSACTPTYQRSANVPGSLGDDPTDGNLERRSFPAGTPLSIIEFLDTTLPCNDGNVDSVETRLINAGCTSYQLITAPGTDGELTERRNPLCPVAVKPQDRDYFLDRSMCAGTCVQVELTFELGSAGCAFYGADSMLNY
jgi:hypothetical protein